MFNNLPLNERILHWIHCWIVDLTHTYNMTPDDAFWVLFDFLGGVDHGVDELAEAQGFKERETEETEASE